MFLIGYRGCGKSTVGRLLAERLGWASVDSDALIEQRAGKPITAIFADDGEPAFRDLEEAVVAELCLAHHAVVSLGGGAVLRATTRPRLLRAGPVVWLRASAETLATRIAADEARGATRPSLTGALATDEVASVLAAREPIYAECATLTIDADALSPEALAEQLAARLGGGS